MWFEKMRRYLESLVDICVIVRFLAQREESRAVALCRSSDESLAKAMQGASCGSLMGPGFLVDLD
jgi:hypothetical protein